MGRYEGGTEHLILNSNGKFDQTLDTAEGVKRLGSGVWAFEPKKGRVELHGYVPISDGYCHMTPNEPAGHAALDPEREYMFFGPLRLGPDEGCPLKQASTQR